MVQNSPIARFINPLTFFITVVAACGLSSTGWSQIVNRAAFATGPQTQSDSSQSDSSDSANHSILVGPNEPWEDDTQLASHTDDAFAETDTAPHPSGLSSAPLRSNVTAQPISNQSSDQNANHRGRPQWSATPNDVAVASYRQQPTDVSRSNVDYSAPVPPTPSSKKPTLYGAKPQPTYPSQFSNALASESNESAHPSDTTFIRTPAHPGDNHLNHDRDSNGSATGGLKPHAHSNATASIYDQPTGSSLQASTDASQPQFESAYLHDQRPSSPAANETATTDAPEPDTFSSPATMARLTAPDRLKRSPVTTIEDPEYSIQQTAYTSPVSPLQPQQFQNNNTNQRTNRRSPPQQSDQNRQGFRRNAAGTPPQNEQPLRQRRQFPDNRSGQRQPQSRTQQSRSQTNSSATAPSVSSSSAAKTVVAKFAFDNNQQSANGLPIRLIDVLRQAQGGARRSQLIPQYWEVYFDRAQTISATNHRDWVASITAAKQTDAASIEVAKSNAENEITFNAIQLTKSQSKMKSLMATADPIIPMNNPTVTRVKTNYDAFKNRGLISSRFEGIDQTLQQMHGLIESRANTAVMAQKNADQVKQRYDRNQSTVDHVLHAGRTWRSAESDFIASMIEYNKAYADYALALPYGNGPVEAVVSMLIAKPSPESVISQDTAGNRPNLSNDRPSAASPQRPATAGDASIAYRSANSNSNSNSNSNDRRPNEGMNRFGQNKNGNTNQQASTNVPAQRPGTNFSGPRSTAASGQSQSSNPNGNQANRFTSNAGFSPTAPSQSSRSSAPASAQPRLNQRPSQFPTGGSNGRPSQAANSISNSEFSQQKKPSNSSFSPFAPADRQKNDSLQRNKQAFPGNRPATQTPAGDRTASRPNQPNRPSRPNPFGTVGVTGAVGGINTAGSPAATQTQPSTSPKPSSSSGFNFGG